MVYLNFLNLGKLKKNDWLNVCEQDILCSETNQ